MLFQWPKHGLGIVIETLIYIVFPSFIGTGDRIFEIGTVPRNFSCMIVTSKWPISVLTFLFQNILISTHKIHVEKLLVCLPGCKLLATSFSSLNNCFRFYFWSSPLYIFFLVFLSLLDFLLLASLCMFPNSDMSSSVLIFQVLTGHVCQLSKHLKLDVPQTKFFLSTFLISLSLNGVII